MVPWTIGFLLFCVCGLYLRPNEAVPVQQQGDKNERSYKRELELFTNEVQDNWEHEDSEYLSRRELEENAREETEFQNDQSNEKDSPAASPEQEKKKRWMDVDSQTNGLGKTASSPAYDDEMPKDGELFQEDIVMDSYVREVFNGEAAKRDAVSLKKYYWPEGIVHYKFDPDIFSYSKRQILTAIDYYHEYTCIKFVRKTDHDNVKDYILFISNGTRCYSNVGRRGGKQIVSIGTGCLRLGTPIHEIMHVLGFFHEMARPDRNENVVIHWENIQPGLKHNFRRIPKELDQNLIPYNYCSVMHYSNGAFSRNGKDTISAIDDPKKKFGQRCGFSVGDIEEINDLYKCPQLNRMLPSRKLCFVICDS